MNTLRRSALALVLLLLLVAPHSLLIAPQLWFFIGSAAQIDVGFYATWALGILWTTLLIWSVVEELPALERRWPAKPQLPWWLAILAGVAALLARWTLWPPPQIFFNAISTVHYFIVVDGGFTIALPALLVLTARALGRPIDVSRVPLHRWIAGTTLILGFLTPLTLAFEIGNVMLFAIATCTMWMRELPSLEAATLKRKWRIRIAALVLGATFILIDIAWRKSLLATDGLVSRLLVRLGDQPFAHLVMLPYWILLHAGGGLAFVALCMTAADGVAYSMRRSRSVRVRMMVLGFACAALALSLADVNIPQYTFAFGKVEVFASMTVIYRVVLLTFMVAPGRSSYRFVPSRKSAAATSMSPSMTRVVTRLPRWRGASTRWSRCSVKRSSWKT